MTHVLAVTAGQDGSPISQFILIKADNWLFHRITRSAEAIQRNPSPIS